MYPLSNQIRVQLCTYLICSSSRFREPSSSQLEPLLQLTLAPGPPPRCCRGSHRELGESPSQAGVSSHSSSPIAERRTSTSSTTSASPS
ncbi:uncharacterized protein DS421_5g154790 [Arachis hypogaea]|nr:uncharacterized protein DS421_5g154790 [Arachis hypogaea]